MILLRHAQLRAFHNVAITGGFSRAADEMGLTQPAVSDQVRKLEREYDVQLFQRSTKQVSLTAEGQRLLEITRRMFEAEQQAADLLSEHLELQSGRLRIMADSTRHILGVLSMFRARNARVFVSVREGNSVEVIDRLHGYDAEIGVMSAPADPGKLEVVSLGETRLVAFVRRDDDLAGCEAISLETLLRHPLVLRERGSKTRAILEDHATRLGHAVQPAMEADGREAVREIVAMGGGVGIVSEAEFSPDPRLRAIPIVDPDMTMAESVVCLKERAESRPIRAFMSIVRGMAEAAAPR